MLSATNTINDMKVELDNYKPYGFDDDGAFVTMLTYSANEAKRRFMLRYLTEDHYDVVAAKDKVGLTREEDLIYWAEVDFARSCFLENIGRREMSRRKAETFSENQDGVGVSSSGLLGKTVASIDFYTRAIRSLTDAGVDTRIQLFRVPGDYSQDDEGDSFSGAAGSY